MSVLLKRRTGTVVVEVEALTGVDGQGAPAYASPVEIDARVVHEHHVLRRPTGTEIHTALTLWADGAQAGLPREEDRVALTDGSTFIVVERKDRRTLQNVLDHVRLRCRRE